MPDSYRLTHLFFLKSSADRQMGKEQTDRQGHGFFFCWLINLEYRKIRTFQKVFMKLFFSFTQNGSVHR